MSSSIWAKECMLMIVCVSWLDMTALLGGRRKTSYIIIKIYIVGKWHVFNVLFLLVVLFICHSLHFCHNMCSYQSKNCMLPFSFIRTITFNWTYMLCSCPCHTYHPVFDLPHLVVSNCKSWHLDIHIYIYTHTHIYIYI